MTLDLTKLTPAPWQTAGLNVIGKGRKTRRGEEPCTIAACCNGPFAPERETAVANRDFIILARAAFSGDPEALAWWEANRVRRGEAKEE